MKVFIDCGFHHGEGLRHFIRMLGINKDWTVIAFEPNPACNAQLRFYKIQEEIQFTPFFNPFAVWDSNARIPFCQENHLKSCSGSPHDNTSSVDGWASQVALLGGQFPGLESPINVLGIDFSNYVMEYRESHNRAAGQQWGTEIYCKMDIEGSEFPVLRKILADGNAGLFKKLWVEFHERFIPGESPQTKAALLSELRQFTEVEEWH